MNFAPYQWRQNQGYLPPPGSVPMPIAPGTMFPSLDCTMQWPGTIGAPGAAHQVAYQAAPYIGGVVAASPPATSSTVSKKEDKKKENKLPPLPPPPPPRNCKVFEVCSVAPSHSASNVSSASEKPSCDCGCSKHKSKSKSSGKHKYRETKITITRTKSSEKKKDEKKEEKKNTPRPPPDSVAASSMYGAPTLRPGMNYMYPRKTLHTMLHIFNKAAPIWKDKYKGQSMEFKMFKVSTDFKVKNIIERITKRDKCDGWVVTEVFESGDGEWRKGTTIKYEDDKAKGDLKGMGWNERRGGGKEDGLPPVWLVVHKA